MSFNSEIINRRTIYSLEYGDATLMISSDDDGVHIDIVEPKPSGRVYKSGVVVPFDSLKAIVDDIEPDQAAKNPAL